YIVCLFRSLAARASLKTKIGDRLIPSFACARAWCILCILCVYVFCVCVRPLFWSFVVPSCCGSYLPPRLGFSFRQRLTSRFGGIRAPSFGSYKGYAFSRCKSGSYKGYAFSRCKRCTPARDATLEHSADRVDVLSSGFLDPCTCKVLFCFGGQKPVTRHTRKAGSLFFRFFVAEEICSSGNALCREQGRGELTFQALIMLFAGIPTRS
ncbi:unnamed protein product, partial [Scytosiphon promiscuus]